MVPLRAACVCFALGVIAPACKVEQNPDWAGEGTDASSGSSGTGTTGVGSTAGSGTTGSSTSTTTDSAGTTGTSGSSGVVTATGSDTGTTGPAPDEHVLFVTSTTFDGNLGGLVGADNQCQAHAAIGGLMGSYKAVLSATGESAVDRLTVTGPVRNTQGELLAADSAALWAGILQTPVAYDESGDSLLAVSWTGSNLDGTTKTTCVDWTNNANDVFGTHGNVNAASSEWLDLGDDRCFKVKHLYCISQ